MLTIFLFASIALLIASIWNWFFDPVPLRVVALLWLVCAGYQATTLFTDRVDIPGNLAFVAAPWSSTGAKPVNANTGIIFTEIAPWTRVARDSILTGQLPLWNRDVACGAPLLANQQTAIFHPFTLAGLLLPIGKAFTLSVCLRLFTVAFFMFILLRGFGISTAISVFGAVAYTFCTFHIVWLLFPLGLATMMLPVCLVGVQEMARSNRPAAYVLLVVGLSCSVLGGHPESAVWVWLVTAAFAVHETVSVSKRVVRARLLSGIASTFVVAMALTSFFWMPTLRALESTDRFAGMQSKAGNPANHHLSTEWLVPLLTPDVLGTPTDGTYHPPRGSHPAVLNDYGEVASGYAGLITLACALAAPFVTRRRPLWFAVCCMAVALLTIAEVPIWRDMIRILPFAGISLLQRLRAIWDFGVCVAAAVCLDEALRSDRVQALQWSLIGSSVAFAAIYLSRRPAFLWTSHLALSQSVVPLVTACTFLVVLARFRRLAPMVAVILVFVDLALATYRYNPAARPVDLYPVTGAIAYLQGVPRPARMVASGWSFIPDTPAYYGLEDVKTTDPVQHSRYMALLRGYLGIEPGSYDMLVRDYSRPFFDFLIRYVYVPPGQAVTDPKFIERYRGPDGTVLENRRALPPAFFVKSFHIEPEFGSAVVATRAIRSFHDSAVVDHIPDRYRSTAPDLTSASALKGGVVRIVAYEPNSTEFAIVSNGWNLLVTSDVNWPGWRAYWNGIRQPPVTVNGAFLGCFVPPGPGRLVLRYRPAEFDLGLRLAAVALAGLIAMMSLWSRGRRGLRRDSNLVGNKGS